MPELVPEVVALNVPVELGVLVAVVVTGVVVVGLAVVVVVVACLVLQST